VTVAVTPTYARAAWTDRLKLPTGVIPIDSIFSPVRRVAYSVEQARVGQRTDYDKLTLDIETDGSIDPHAALREAAEILISQLAIFTDADRVVELREAGGPGPLEAGAPAGAPGAAPARHPVPARRRGPLGAVGPGGERVTGPE